MEKAKFFQKLLGHVVEDGKARRCQRSPEISLSAPFPKDRNRMLVIYVTSRAWLCTPCYEPACRGSRA